MTTDQQSTEALHATDRGFSPAACLGVAALAGLASGVATMFLQGLLPGDSNQLANSGAVWAAGAFIGGALLRGGRAALGAAVGTLVQLGLVLGYYLSVWYRYDQDGPGLFFYLWLVIACISGPLFGIAGVWWRSSTGWRGIAALAVLGGVFCGEGAYLLAMFDDRIPYGVGSVLTGLLIPIVLTPRSAGSSGRARLAGLAGAVACAAAVLLLFAGLNLAGSSAP